MMIILQLFWLIGSLSASPQYFNGFRGYGGYGGYGGYVAPLAPLAPLTVDIGTEVQRIIASPLASDTRIASQPYKQVHYNLSVSNSETNWWLP